jgi:hypothetical protein
VAKVLNRRTELATINRDIANGEMRISRMIVLIEEMAKAGHDTTGVQKMLLIMQETLAKWYVHRDQILQAIEQENELEHL